MVDEATRLRRQAINGRAGRNYYSRKTVRGAWMLYEQWDGGPALSTRGRADLHMPGPATTGPEQYSRHQESPALSPCPGNQLAVAPGSTVARSERLNAYPVLSAAGFCVQRAVSCCVLASLRISAFTGCGRSGQISINPANSEPI